MSEDVKAVVEIATALYGKIKRAYDNLTKLGEGKITLGAVEARLAGLEKNWDKFDGHNDDLLDHLAELKDNQYLKQDIPSLAEEAYLLNKGLMLDLKRQLTDEQLAAAAAKAPVAPPPSTNHDLPRIQLPQFTGKFEDWPAWRPLLRWRTRASPSIFSKRADSWAAAPPPTLYRPPTKTRS